MSAVLPAPSIVGDVNRHLKEGKMSRIRKPGPAMVVALVALFVALSGSAVAAGIVPLAKRALSADNAKHALVGQRQARAVADSAKKVGTQTAAQIVQQAVGQASQAPGPASSAAGLLTVKTATWSNSPRQGQMFTVTCDAGQKAVGGGYDDAMGWSSGFDTKPTSDDGGWQVFIGTSSNAPGQQSGTLYAVCLK